MSVGRKLEEPARAAAHALVGGPASVPSLPPTVRVFVVVEPFDMRGSFAAIAGAAFRQVDPGTRGQSLLLA